MPAPELAIETTTILALGARGALDGAPFVLTGRTCVRGRLGSLWNEWSLRFDDGRRAFLAEATGELTLYEEGVLAPAWDALAPGAALDVGYVVVERGTATRLATWGETETAPATYAYADLSSRGGAPATLDFGDGVPRLFAGRRVSLGELGLSAAAPHPRLVAAPDVSRPKGVETWLDIGGDGVLEGRAVRILGVVSRAMPDGTRWDEYLLHETGGGVRWLVLADGSFSLAAPVEAGLIHEEDGGATLHGSRWEARAEGIARVEWAAGELPWAVTIGEAVTLRELGSDGADAVLTKEWTEDAVAWSCARPIPTDVVAQAFGKRALPRPR